MYKRFYVMRLSSLGATRHSPQRGKQGGIKGKTKKTNDKRQSVTKQAKPARRGKQETLRTNGRAKKRRFFKYGFKRSKQD